MALCQAGAAPAHSGGHELGRQALPVQPLDEHPVGARPVHGGASSAPPVLAPAVEALRLAIGLVVALQTLPVLLLFVFARRLFTSAVLGGAVKG